MLFSDWGTLLRTLVIGVLAYATVILVLRVSGKRTLSKWNAFDLVITVSFGSSLATAILSKDASFLQVAVAFALLTFLQFAVTWCSVRFSAVERIVKARPTLLLYQGALCRDAMIRERVTEEELRAALRGRGIPSTESVAAVVLETDGTFSVLESLEQSDRSTLAGVSGYPPDTGAGEAR